MKFRNPELKIQAMAFGGCSFTWGQGLYYYSNLPTLKEPPPDQYRAEYITEAHRRYMASVRFPRLVANHFNTFEVVKIKNGGCEDETFEMFQNIFNDPEKMNMITDLCTERYTYDDFSYIIIQISQLFRNRFKFELNGIKYETNLSPRSNYGDPSKLLKWMELNNYTYEDWVDCMIKQQLPRLEKEIRFYEDKGIKVRFLLWEDDLLTEIKSNSYLKERLITLEYENSKFDTISKLYRRHEDLLIEKDPYFEGKTIPVDLHPSKKCHQIIADNIIRVIENDNL